MLPINLFYILVLGPKPLMDQRPPYREPQPPMPLPTTSYTPESPTQPHPEPLLQFNYDAPPVPDRSSRYKKKKFITVNPRIKISGLRTTSL